MSAAAAAIEWFAIGERLPDSDATVLLFNRQAANPVGLGSHDGRRWRNANGLIAVPTHWAVRPAA